MINCELFDAFIYMIFMYDIYKAKHCSLLFYNLGSKEKQGPQNQRNSAKNSLMSLKIQNTPTDTGHFHLSNHHKWLPYQILGGQNRKERTNRSTNNGDIVHRPKRSVFCL